MPPGRLGSRRESFRVGGRRTRLMVDDNKEGAEELALFRKAMLVPPEERGGDAVALIGRWFSKNFPVLLRDLGDDMVERLLAGVQYERFQAGEVVYKQGEAGTKFYMV